MSSSRDCLPLPPQDLSFESQQAAAVATETTVEAIRDFQKGLTKMDDAAVTGAGDLLDEPSVSSGFDSPTTSMELDEVSELLAV
jgi:hypothetical protein